jgi:hypothetical protein
MIAAHTGLGINARLFEKWQMQKGLGTTGREPAWQTQGPEFKSQYQQENPQNKNSSHSTQNSYILLYINYF